MRLLRGIGVILCSVGISFGALAQSESAVPGPKTCKDFREWLPRQDPMFQLTGKITMKSGVVYEVTQFGRPGFYHNYIINLRDALRGDRHYLQARAPELLNYQI
jgi:hypothetical protein